jgi:hypothetical protein
VAPLARSMEPAESAETCPACQGSKFIPIPTWATKTCAQFRGEAADNCRSNTVCRRWACSDCDLVEWKRRDTGDFCTLHPGTLLSFFPPALHPHPNARFHGQGRTRGRGFDTAGTSQSQH